MPFILEVASVILFMRETKVELLKSSKLWIARRKNSTSYLLERKKLHKLKKIWTNKFEICSPRQPRWHSLMPTPGAPTFLLLKRNCNLTCRFLYHIVFACVRFLFITRLEQSNEWAISMSAWITNLNYACTQNIKVVQLYEQIQWNFYIYK